MKIVRQAQAFAPTLNGWDKIHHNIQKVIYNEIHHSGLPSYSNNFDCHWAQICVQDTLFHFETDMPMSTLKELHQVHGHRGHGSLRKQLVGHGQATVSGEWALAWLLRPLYGYNQIAASYRRQNTPLNKEMMNIRCAIVAHFGHRLKTSKSESPPWSFM